MIRTITFIIWFSLAGSLAAQTLQVDFKVRGLPDSIVYIGYHFGNQKYVLDTLNVENEAFSLMMEEARVKPGLYFIYTPDYYLDFVLEKRPFGLSAEYSGGYRELEITNSPENELFKTFQVELGALQAEQRRLQAALPSEEDSLQIQNRLKEVSGEMDAFLAQMVEKDPESFTVAFLQLMEDTDVPTFDSITDPVQRRNAQYRYYKKHYFDLIDLSDSRLLRTPLLHEKVMKYFDKLLVQRPDTVIHELDWFFEQVGTDTELYRYWLVTFFKHYTESKVMGMDAVTVHLIENYYLTDDANWVTEEYEEKLREEVAYVKPNLIGRTAPPLNVVDTLMQPLFLGQIESPYTLVFIYDPDCGHCKSTIKELEKVDKELTNLGVQVLAVCTITDVKRWKEFVTIADPTWLHAIDPTGQSYFRVTYNVRTTPKIYLLDGEKRIVAKQLDIGQVIRFLQRGQ